jgi:hypothetical protein
MIPLADFTLGHALLTVLETFLFVAWIWVRSHAVAECTNER